MAKISCGHCGGTHGSVAEVRACHLDTPPGSGASGAAAAPATAELPLFETPVRARAAAAHPVPARTATREPEPWGDDVEPDWGWDDAEPDVPDYDDAPRRIDQPPPRARPRPLAALPVPEDGFAGPEALGRGLVVTDDEPVPAAWADAARHVLDSATLADPGTTVDALLDAWHARQRVVMELRVPFEDAPATVLDGPVWEHQPTLLLELDRLHHLVWANAVDLRQRDQPRWTWAERAVAAGAEPGGPADVVLADGTPAWCDGGPIGTAAVDALVAAGDTAAVLHRITLERDRLVPLGSSPCTAELAPDQLAAVTHAGGAARIIAPAGSGKTRVLTERARHLLRSWRVPAASLCLVAFNERAASEMRERTTDLEGLQVRTLNALGLAVLDGRGGFAKRGGRYAVLDERAQRDVLGTLVEVPRRLNTDPLAPWLEALSQVRLGLRSPAEVEESFGGDIEGLHDVLVRYRAVLRDRHAVDFDEQITTTIEVLLAEPATRAVAQRACRLLLVDEFQDLAPAHLLMVRLLGSPDLSTFGVGDDDQTIYGFSGATPEWLIGYAGLFPGSGDHPLEVNYRCPPAVVNAAGTLLARNTRRVAKVIRPAPGRADEPGSLAVLSSPDTVIATADAVAAAIAAGARPDEIAVLTRVNATLAAPQVMLGHRGIPVEHAVDERWLDRTGVRAALAWLRLASAPTRLRAADIREAGRRPPRGRSPKLVDWMSEQRSIDDLRRLAGRLNERDGEKVNQFAEDLVGLARVAADGTTALLREVRRLGLDDTMSALDGFQRAPRQSGHLDDLDALIELASLCPEPDGFAEWLRGELGRPGDKGGVRLATVHKVKGREWPHVVLHDAGADQFPHRLATDVEEERRVFHVGLTRGSRTVTVVAPAGAPSPFVSELTGGTPTVRGRTLITSSSAPASARTTTRPAGRSGARDGSIEVSTDPPPAHRVEALKAWRLQRSRTDGVPAYVVFQNATLDDIARKGPTTLVELGRIKGIGPGKLERYGADVLAIVEAAG